MPHRLHSVHPMACDIWLFCLFCSHSCCMFDSCGTQASVRLKQFSHQSSDILFCLSANVLLILNISVKEFYNLMTISCSPGFQVFLILTQAFFFTFPGVLHQLTDYSRVMKQLFAPM